MVNKELKKHEKQYFHLDKVLTITIIVCIIFGFLFVRGLASMSVSYTVWGNDEFCRQKYASNLRGSDYIGSFCIRMEESTQGEYGELIQYSKYYYTDEDVDEHCGKLPFWSLTEWNGRCG